MTGLAEAEFEALRRHLSRAAGLVFDAGRRHSLALSVQERLHATGDRTVAAYLTRLTDPVEQQHLLDEVTVQETCFFRPPQMGALRTYVLPELLRAAAGRRRLRVWSAGCSTGEEPYTLAMLLRAQVPAGWDVQVLGTDVSRRAVEAARAGHYGRRSVQRTTPEELARSFTPAGRGYDVRPEVRALVALRQHNLVTDPLPYAAGEVDLVLCRNVTIYFAAETTRRLVQRLHGVLRPGGYLLLGHAETLWQVSEDFELVPVGSGADAAFLYRARGPQAVTPADRRRPPAQDTDPVRRAAAAVEAAPLRADLRHAYGHVLAERGRDAEAAPVLRGALYLDPQDGLAHFLLAGVLSRLGDAEAAGREYAAAAEALLAAPPDPAAPELGGRAAGELAALCRFLSTPRGRSAQPSAYPAGPSGPDMARSDHAGRSPQGRSPECRHRSPAASIEEDPG